MFFNPPTLLTWARIAAIPLIMGVYYTPLEPHTQNTIAAILFIVFALTDWLVCASILILVHLQRADVFAALIIIGREIAISALREWMAQIGASRSVAVHILGKLKTSVQMTAIPLLLYNDRLLNLIDTHIWGYWLLWIAVILTIWSMAYYLQKALPEIRARVR